MVSSEEVRRTRGCRGRQGFSAAAAAQGTLATQERREEDIKAFRAQLQQLPSPPASPHPLQRSQEMEHTEPGETHSLLENRSANEGPELPVPQQQQLWCPGHVAQHSTAAPGPSEPRSRAGQ